MVAVGKVRPLPFGAECSAGELVADIKPTRLERTANNRPTEGQQQYRPQRMSVAASPADGRLAAVFQSPRIETPRRLENRTNIGGGASG